MNDYRTEIQGHVLEYFDDSHTYLVDGLIVPSITQMLTAKFGNKYQGVRRETLDRAARLGTETHEQIERAVNGEEVDSEEVRNFRFLQSVYHFDVIASELPVILFLDDDPIAAGRLDLVIKMRFTADRGNSAWYEVGGADIKRTSTLDREYLAYQLNLYRIAYRQSYGVEWQFLRGIWLRGEKRKFVTIPINEEMTWRFIREQSNFGRAAN